MLAQSAFAKLAKGLLLLKVAGGTHVCEFGSLLHSLVLIHQIKLCMIIACILCTIQCIRPSELSRLYHRVQYKLIYNYIPSCYDVQMQTVFVCVVERQMGVCLCAAMNKNVLCKWKDLSWVVRITSSLYASNVNDKQENEAAEPIVNVPWLKCCDSACHLVSSCV